MYQHIYRRYRTTCVRHLVRDFRLILITTSPYKVAFDWCMGQSLFDVIIGASYTETAVA